MLIKRPPMPTPDTSSRLWLDTLIAPAWITEAQGGVIYANRALLKYSGLSSESLEASFPELLFPEDREEALTIWKGSREEGRSGEHAVRLLDQDGRPRWFCVQFQPVAGTPGRWLAVAHDIHALKLVEEQSARVQAVTAELSQAHDQAGILAALPLCARVMDAPRASVTVLHAAERELHLVGAHGYPEESLGAFRVLDAAVSVPAADVMRTGAPLILSGEAFAASYPHLVGKQDMPSGTLALLPLIANGIPVGVLTLGFLEAREVEAADQRFMLLLAELLAQALERVRLFEEERATRIKTRSMLNAVPQLVWTSRPDEAPMHFNRPWAEYTGLGEMLDRDAWRDAWRQVIHPDDRATVQAARAEGIAKGQVYICEVRFRRHDGAYRWHEATVHPLEGGEWLGVAIDIHDRREAELAQAQSEAQLSAVLDALPVGVLIADETGRLVRDNAAHRELWGMAPQTTNWEGYGEWVGWWPDTGKRLEADEWAMTRALLEGKTVRGELVEYQPFGSVERRFFLNNAAPIHDAVGRLIGGVVAEQDVTAQVAAERALRENAERVQLALAAGAILGTWFWDLRSDRFTVDEGFAVNFGLDPAVGRERLSLEQVIATVHPEDRAGLIAEINEAIRCGGPYTHQYRVRRRDGRYYWIEASGRVDHAEDGTPLSFPGVLLDLEERRAMLSALRESETRFRELADHISQFAWTADASGSISWYNQRWYDYTGTTLEQMQGWGWQAAHHPDHVERVLMKFRRAVEAGEAWEDTFPLRGKDGTYRWFLSRALPIRDQGGQVMRWFGTNTDVTEQRETQAQLLELNMSLEARVADRTRELQAANEELGAFAYTVSHDLRAPVRHVSSFAGLLRRKIGDQPGLLRYVEQIEGAAARMETLTDALLGLARAGMTELNKTDVDLGALVAAVRDDLAAEVMERKVTWQVGDLPTVRADAGLLRQVFANLLGNALKYSRGREEAAVEVWVENTSVEVTVAVRDNGAGFDPGQASKLFGVFQRLHHQDEFEGTGVGLANVKRVVEKHGGRVWAEGRLGKGATFFFTLPHA
ncbi:hypothetical protein GCM10008949_16900 [Deinococcus humi]|nr:hypothetical protein GCM10008949_16900 [Deinococcus humi]